MSDIRVTSDKTMETYSFPLPVPVRSKLSSFSQQLQRALTARGAPSELQHASACQKSPEQTPTECTRPSSTMTNSTAADTQTVLAAIMGGAWKNSLPAEFIAANPAILPAYDGLDGSDVVDRLLNNPGSSSAGAFPFQMSGAGYDGLEPGDLSSLLMAQADDAKGDASMPSFGTPVGFDALMPESGGTATAEMARMLTDIGPDDGIFEVLMPNGQRFSVAVTVQPNTVRYLMNPSCESLRNRLKNCRMELEQSMERRIQRNVEIAVL